MCSKFKIIGLSDSRRQFSQPDIHDIIRKTRVFSGGKRHHEIILPHLPPEHIWIDVTVPLKNVFKKYDDFDEITVFASGDPLFFGFAATLKREFPKASIEVFPSFNSLQMLSHRVNMPYQDMHNVSLTGRPWKNLDDALINGYEKIGCLTDRHKSPSEIARRMLEYGYCNYHMSVGISLGNESEEEIKRISLEEAASTHFSTPNCVILKKNSQRPRYFGVPEMEFHRLPGRANMITKMPIRLLSLAMLDLPNRKSLWDIGFCTGSVSIEARLQFPHLDITSFEKREESRELMDANCRKLGTPSIESVIGDFLKVDLSRFVRPDAVFIGGHGGKLMEIMEKLNSIMPDDCIIVFNAVSVESRELFRTCVASIGKKIVEEHVMQLDSFNPITILKAL